MRLSADSTQAILLLFHCLYVLWRQPVAAFEGIASSNLGGKTTSSFTNLIACSGVKPNPLFEKRISTHK